MGYYVFEYSAGTSLFLHMATHKREASLRVPPFSLLHTRTVFCVLRRTYSIAIGP